MTATEATQIIIRQIRRDAGFRRQAEFGQFIGKNRDWVARRERGETATTPDDLQDWASGCGIPVADVLRKIAARVDLDGSEENSR